MNFYKRKPKRISDNYIYSDSLITRSIYLSIIEIDKNLKETITKKIKKEYEGKCIVEGYIQKDSCQIVSYSSGLIKGVNIIYDVVFKCKTCFPVEGMNINCIAINITKSAGIRAEIADVSPSPAVIFITRDHHYNDDYFSQIKEGDRFSATVIGQRFELNDKFISIIAKLIQPSSEKIYSTKSKFVDDDEPQNTRTQKPTKTSKTLVKSKIILSDEDGPTLENPNIEEEEEELVLVPKQFNTQLISTPPIPNEDDEEEIGFNIKKSENNDEDEVLEGNQPDVEDDEFEGI
jgi:DNA-directed RNA polymerase subunit E'/Rpb7